MVYDGSSPHAWGIPHHQNLATSWARFIPTCVGNTISLNKPSLSASVHPHMRGEYNQYSTLYNSLPGSSCVGNTSSYYYHSPPFPVHPHMRGEYFLFPSPHQLNNGSSPHAWGIPEKPTDGADTHRFIPTCVGNTHAQVVGLYTVAVHPHMRGEYSSRKHEEFSMVIIAAKIYRSGTA